MKGKALRRALETKDVIRIAGDVPLILDTTEWITPTIAQEMLKRNKSNRPINWNKVEEYSKIMAAGKWKLHAQGIILDTEGNILTGQKRLWALIYSGVSGLHMRISRGNPADTANLIDRGTPQSARDLATRKTDKKHSPTEASIARALLALEGKMRPSADEIAALIVSNAGAAAILLEETKRVKKSKAVLMVMAAICSERKKIPIARAAKIEQFAEKLDESLNPVDAAKCWGKGAAFTMAMTQALKIIQ